MLAATPDGFHVLGADTTTFSDIWLEQSASGPAGVPAGACPAYTAPPLSLDISVNSGALPITAAEIDQVVSSPNSSVAFVTYNAGAATGMLPYYMPSATLGAFGTLATVQLSAGAVAPVAGIFSPDGAIFFTSTSGDNLVHLVNTTTLTDTQTLNPQLTNGSGVAVPAQFLAVKSRSTT
jgi:hypothetical protein